MRCVRVAALAARRSVLDRCACERCERGVCVSTTRSWTLLSHATQPRLFNTSFTKIGCTWQAAMKHSACPWCGQRLAQGRPTNIGGAPRHTHHACMPRGARLSAARRPPQRSSCGTHAGASRWRSWRRSRRRPCPPAGRAPAAARACWAPAAPPRARAAHDPMPASVQAVAPDPHRCHSRTQLSSQPQVLHNAKHIV
jgi:hypothetical protein